VTPLFNSAAFFLFCQSVLLYSFSVVVLIVYYRIPASYGLIVHLKNTSIKDLNKRWSGISESRTFSLHPSNTADLVIENMAIDEAAEDKILRNS
jgi:hypothetical protein